MKLAVDIIAIRITFDSPMSGYVYEIAVDFTIGGHVVTHRAYDIFDSDYIDSLLEPLVLLGWLTGCINESREIPAHRGKWIV